MIRWTTSLSVIAACLGAALVSSAGCGSDSSEGSGGAGGEASASSSSSSAQSSSSSSAQSSSSTGGSGCGDTMTDPLNCGACDHVCVPGQTCVAGVCTCGTASVAFAEVQTILTQSCATAGCHAGSFPKEGLNLDATNAYAELVNKPASQCNDGRLFVSPGNPNESYLINKMMGVDLCFGKRMPAALALGDAKIQTVADWICGGALP